MNTMTLFPFDITGKHSLFHNNILKWLPFICCIFVNRGELQITNLSLSWHHGMEMTSTLLALCDRMNLYMVHSLKKSQWRGSLLFLWMLAWTKKQWSDRLSEPPWCPEDISVMQQVLTFSALLALCARNSLVTGEFPSQKPVTRSFAVFFYLRLNKWLSKQSWGWWFKMPSCSLWPHCNEKRCYSRLLGMELHFFLHQAINEFQKSPSTMAT